MCRGFSGDTLLYVFFLVLLLLTLLEVFFVMTPVAVARHTFSTICCLCRSFGDTAMVHCSTMTGSRLGCMKESTRSNSSRLI